MPHKRTVFAWIRTSMRIIVFGLMWRNLGITLREFLRVRGNADHESGVSLLGGVRFMPMGIIMALVATFGLPNRGAPIGCDLRQSHWQMPWRGCRQQNHSTNEISVYEAAIALAERPAVSNFAPHLRFFRLDLLAAAQSSRLNCFRARNEYTIILL